jgi:hypothetical protein
VGIPVEGYFIFVLNFFFISALLFKEKTRENRTSTRFETSTT